MFAFVKLFDISLRFCVNSCFQNGFKGQMRNRAGRLYFNSPRRGIAGESIMQGGFYQR